jgi:hypothetical protein
MQNSQELLQNTLQPTIQKDNSLSIYRGELSTMTVINEMKRLKYAFPQLPQGFYDILSDRIKANGFSDDRLKDAINNIIDNCIYPVPSIANIISFDKRVKLYTYTEILDLVNQFGASVWNSYKAIETGSKRRLYASIAEIEKFNLKVLQK